MVLKSVAAGLVMALALAGAAQAAARPEGPWIAASGNVEVRIAPCGPALCGAVVRVMANNSMQALAASKAPPARVGLRIFSDLVAAGDGQWRGHIYNRENGRTYDCLITPHDRDMTVRVFVGLPAFGQTQVWRRGAG